MWPEVSGLEASGKMLENGRWTGSSPGLTEEDQPLSESMVMIGYPFSSIMLRSKFFFLLGRSGSLAWLIIFV